MGSCTTPFHRLGELPKASFLTFPNPRIAMIRLFVMTIGSCVLAASSLHAADNPVKVFILAGQSNMEGQGFIKADPKRNGGKGSLEYLLKDPATADKFKHLVDKDGKWVVRDDVWIHYLGRKGRLTVGYGAKEDRIGPELGFGHVIGDAYEEPVLLIKLAWGGKSLAKDFRPAEFGRRSRAVLQGDRRDGRRPCWET